MKPIFTIAATSDIHVDKYNFEKKFFPQVNDSADLLLIAGDISNGKVDQVERFLSLISRVKIPIVVVFGGHDANENNLEEVRTLLLKNPQITVLEEEYVEYKVNDIRVGISGAKGLWGGFAPNELRGDIGEGVIKNFVKEGDLEVAGFRRSLKKMEKASPDVKIAMTHVAPFKELVAGESVEIYPFLGNSKLGDAIKEVKVDLAISGHAHLGPKGLKKISDKILACNVGYSVNDKKMVWFDFFGNGKVMRNL
jgi:Icc-related predicted phosphoesterase